MLKKDKAHVSDELFMDNQLVAHNNSADIIGEVEVIYTSKNNGKVMFTRSLNRNDLLVTGAVFLSEKMNDQRSTFQTIPLDLEIGVHTNDQIIVDNTTISKERVCGIMVGNGGSGDTYNTVYKVNRAARSVPGYLPFRVVPVDEDLNETDRSKYMLRVVKGDLVYYYGKRFDIDREINVQYEDGTVVSTDVDTQVVSKFIKTFTKYRVTLDQRDIREFFKITQGSTLRSLINSVGLITGYPGLADDGFDEFFNVRGMTTLNMENKELKDSESTVTFIYKLYIQ